MERAGDILDELEKDQEEHLLDMTVEEALNLQVADEEALEAVEKVAHVAQSSLRRLQQVVKEKDELIVVLQEAVSAAHKTALDQHESDQNDLGQLHQLLLTQEDRSVQGITNALQTVVSQQPLSGNSLAGQVARLFDQYLHEISIKHEQENEDMQRSVALLHSRCQELEESLDHEKRKAKCYLSAQLDEKVAVYSNKLMKSEDLVEKLKRQLNEKEEQLGVYDNTVRELERLLEEEKERESNLSQEHERICEEARRSLGQVSNFGQQLQKLKDQTSKFKKQEHEHEHQVRELQDKVTGQKALVHKLSVQLAALRKKSNIVKPPTEFKEAEAAHETQNLQDSVSELRAQISFLEGELREARKESNDDSVITYSEDIIVKDETRIPMPQIVERLADHDKLARKVETLRRTLKATKRELHEREHEMSMAAASVQQVRKELIKSKEIIEQLREKKRKMMDSVKKRPTDNVRLKGLLENIETLETDNAVLKHEVTVQKNRRIANLERELRRVQGLDLLIDGKQHSCSRAVKFSDESAAEKVKKEMEDIIANKESMILELKFEADQATWKLAQVEKRFSILYGALECKKIELNAPVADSLLEHIFSSGSGELSIPALNLLREKVLHLRGFSRSGSRERELQDLVEALLKVVEKLNSENGKLKQSCEDTVKHMEKNRKLRRVMHDLQDDTGKVAGISEHLMETGIISDLRTKLLDLTEANSGLVKALRESEDMYSALKQRVHEQQSKERKAASGMTGRTGRRRCSSSEETESVSDQEWKLKCQAETIQNLEKQLAGRDDEVAQLNRQLEMKDDELDLLHGKLWLQETAEEPTESMYQKNVDMWSAQEANTKYCDVKLCPTDDYIDNEFIEENEWESLKEENRKLKTATATKIGPEFFEELGKLKDRFEFLTELCPTDDYIDNEFIEENEWESLKEENRKLKTATATKIGPEFFEELGKLKDRFEFLTEVCERYEELLRIYSKQIGVPFTPLSKVKKIWEQ